MDDWTHSFCLACDKQVHTASDAYCSESCRLADFEKTSTPSSQASSPGFTPPGYPWTTRSASNAGFFLSPAYDFTNAKPYGTTLHQQSAKPTEHSARVLTPSSSHSSLCSMQSTSTTGESGQLSDKTKRELRAYAVSFEQVRMQRRRSY
ncbi:hypothetical protein B0J13DRAFT_216064 [Dactylonectria estremocensis]|uniref:Life-span regulatory factor domain-containing protein n=1 Tax=Dactylonectria estremocensis TaxID=1079267 RepID=A0A9P9F7X2_9HYPO|nr:hypothetical protein B0J13DRAFT_216064 [Dactylonectria estremocensis]